MNVLDLFSGIGGFSLGLERAGMRTVAFCEVDPFCRAVLKKHWPHVHCFGDIRAIHGEKIYVSRDGRRKVACGDFVIPAQIDVICGGFPCQDISDAGARVGISGARSGLWREYRRLIGDIRPRHVIVENVSGLLNRGLDAVLGDLAALGYDAEWHCIPASAVGFPHERDRIWIVADTAALRRHEGGWSTQGWGRLVWAWLRDCAPSAAAAANDDEIRSSFLRIVDGLPNRVDRLGSLGNAVVPQIPEIIGRAIMMSAAHNSCQGNGS